MCCAKWAIPARPVECYRRALALEPTYAVAHNNLGNALKERGETAKAIASYYRALSAAPDFAEAHFNLARAFREQGKLAEAEASLRRGLAFRPNSPQERNDLASTLMLQGRLVPAFEAIRQSLQIKDTQEAKRIFVNCIRHSDWRSNFGELQPLMLRALTEPWDRPSDLAYTCARFLKHDPLIGPAIARAADAWPEHLPAELLFGPDGPAPFAANPLFEALLCMAPNADMEMERFLTMARRLLLEAAKAGTEADTALGFTFRARPAVLHKRLCLLFGDNGISGCTRTARFAVAIAGIRRRNTGFACPGRGGLFPASFSCSRPPPAEESLAGACIGRVCATDRAAGGRKALACRASAPDRCRGRDFEAGSKPV